MDENNQAQAPYNPENDPAMQAVLAKAKKKPIYKKWWFWLIIVVVLIIAAAASSGDGEGGEPATDADGQTIVTTAAPAATTEDPAAYKAACQSLAYKDLARNPDNYKGQQVTMLGEVIQVQESGDRVDIRIDVTKDEYGYWSDTVYVTLTIPKGEDRILEDDIIAVYGECQGQYTYESILGQSISLPRIDAKYYEIIE